MVNRLFTWSEGLFRFDSELLPPKDKITVRISLENLIIDGTRRMREWEQLQGEIPSLEMALKFCQRQGVNLRNLNLSADEWKVISFINPKNTIHQIAKATNKNDLEIRRIVYSFIQAGLVEMIRPEGVAVRQPAPASPLGNQFRLFGLSSLFSCSNWSIFPSSQSAQPKIVPIQGSKTEIKSLITRIINRIRSI